MRADLGRQGTDGNGEGAVRAEAWRGAAVVFKWEMVVADPLGDAGGAGGWNGGGEK